MLEIKKSFDEFVKTVKDSQTAIEYEKQKEIINSNPELKKRIDDFRKQNYSLQTATDEDILFDELDRFEREHAEFRKLPQVNHFLAAELAYCRMIQEIEDAMAIAFAKDFE